MIVRVFWVLVGTFVVGIVLLIAANPIAHQLLPCDVDQTPAGSCRVNDIPSNYELTDEDGNVIGEFNTWHAVLYVLGHDQNVSLQTTPRELHLLAFGSVYGLAFFITLLLFSLSSGLRGRKSGGGGGTRDYAFAAGGGQPRSGEMDGPETGVVRVQNGPQPAACSSCDMPLAGNARFCQGCGAAVVVQPEAAGAQPREVYCAGCGTAMPASSSFCHKCGMKAALVAEGAVGLQAETLPG
jgi:hypothetical protein